MVTEEMLSLLALVHFLRDLSQEELYTLAETLTVRNFEPDEVIAEQGEPLKALYFILRGEVHVLSPGAESTTPKEFGLTGGDTLGETELVLDLPWLATLKAAGPTKLLRWSRDAALSFLASHPQALTHMRFAAGSRLFAQQLNFDWLAPDEVIYGLVRKHVFKLVQGEVLPALVLLVSAGLGWWFARGGSPAVGWGALGMAAVGVLAAVWQWIDWGNDYYLVTNQRAVWLEKVVALYDSRREAPLHQVLSVSVSTDVLGRLLGFGDVIIRTFTGQVVFAEANSPQAMAAMIEEHWRRLQMRREEEDRETKARAIRDVLAERERGEVIAERPAPPPPAKSADQTALGRWTFEVRFEEEGVITYRKHWAVLVQSILWPTLAVLAVLALPVARLSGRLAMVPLSSMLLLTTLILVPILVWWGYQYVDWANDLYQVTPSQIVDVYKRPLGREIRKVAPLENILGTEVDRRGIIGLVLNFGNVIANVGTQQIDFVGVFDPTGVQQDIVRAQEAFMERKHESERRQRREEMVEWLNVYHEQVEDDGSPRSKAQSTDPGKFNR